MLHPNTCTAYFQNQLAQLRITVKISNTLDGYFYPPLNFLEELTEEKLWKLAFNLIEKPQEKNNEKNFYFIYYALSRKNSILKKYCNHPVFFEPYLQSLRAYRNATKSRSSQHNFPGSEWLR
jgi:hypothetical protein